LGSADRTALASTRRIVGVSMPADGGMLQRVLLCMSSSAHARSVAQAMECQFLPCPRVSLEMPVKAGLGASAVVAMIAGGA
jgi:hypothetical protein